MESALDDPLRLRHARIHEVQGPGRDAFAIFQAARHPGPVFWACPFNQRGMLYPPGMPEGLAGRIYLMRARSEVDLLWATEEALRASVTGLVVSEPQQPLSLTAGRRLQLAAEKGGTTGLMLIAPGQGSNATESRWHCRPVAGMDARGHHWAMIKNKHGPTGDWHLRWMPQEGGDPVFSR
ncbi:hypothetical protein Q4511_03140 [Paracoccus sp. 1_MG-2023]|uniref:ImuA family protein n=1 Tax=unclassified Paracoccus (in: a-proteobacteria) TaxID=2688777 RepID=UPI001C095214|nr:MULTISPECIES: hypothetical protein [unclassified Paracoccus (in: a-proteobacteria)]MBU2956230.1 hypothetical protein [Paracoccus sp. C2R09]MDO6667907.1 hypothetical protein [Paracoccus sp. 1_MG-2023]